MVRKSEAGVYQIENIINGNLYIGSSANLRSRKYQHFYQLDNNQHSNNHLQSSYNKYGKENFVWSVLLYINIIDIKELKETLFNKEQEYINQYPFNKLYNFLPVAGSPLGTKMLEKTKEKIRLSNTGKKHTKETLIKLSDCKKGNKAWLGKNHREETKKIMSSNQLGSNNSFYKKNHTKETKEKISKSLKNRTSHRKGKGKRILNISADEVFSSMEELITHYGFKYKSNIYDVCNGKRDTAYGYKWKYIED